MASHVVVLDSSFRRTIVKVTPGTFMTDVLEEACSKFKLNASNYGLKNNNKPVDISRTFRQTGLVSGAKLELVAASRTPSAVQVALQLPESVASGIPSGRLIEKFSSNTTIWKILRAFEDKQGANLNFTARGVTEIDSGSSGAGRIYYEMPSINAMNRELSTFGDLQKTLAQLGLNSGSCLLRLSFKKTDQPLEEAMKEIGTYFKEEETLASEKPMSAAPPKQEQDPEPVIGGPASLPAGESQQSKDVEMTPAPESPEVKPSATVVVGSSERAVSVFSPPSASIPQAALQPHNENDYEPSVAHAKLHQARLLNNSHNKRLLSDAETEQLEKEKAARLAASTDVSIKVRFPDQSTIISTFTSRESALDLYKAVTASIDADDQPFKLVYTDKGTSTLPRDDSKLLIRNLGLQGRVLVNFHWEDDADPKVRQQLILKPHLREKAQEVKVPEAALVEEKAEPGSSKTDDKGKGKDGDGEKKSKGGVPKWLKLGKK